ncbi:hypothetical protein VV11_023765 [Trichodesmium erythraeum 21-75]|nr:hypothetical protein [Trichodesmium erythraeum 21-75]
MALLTKSLWLKDSQVTVAYLGLRRRSQRYLLFLKVMGSNSHKEKWLKTIVG